MSKILITGGAGYIGTHTLVELHKAGYEFIVYDNLYNSSIKAIERVEEIINSNITFIEGDINDKISLSKVFNDYKVESVIHFAGLKAVGDSVKNPLQYYYNNISGTISLLEVMKENNCKNIVFSSSATVYGDPHTPCIKEDFPLQPANPYGRTKLYIEELLRDLYASDSEWKVIILRYFNPVGAHKSGLIGEDPNGVPNNLMPFISQTAVGKREYLSVFGDDYSTPDGTGVRDYIHVVDLADGHVKALQKINTIKEVLTINLGTGKGYSVLDVVKAFEKASKTKVPYKIVERRSGDVAEYFTNPSYANKILDWKATRDIDDMCLDTWRWQNKNPNGYN